MHLMLMSRNMSHIETRLEDKIVKSSLPLVPGQHHGVPPDVVVHGDHGHPQPLDQQPLARDLAASRLQTRLTFHHRGRQLGRGVTSAL